MRKAVLVGMCLLLVAGCGGYFKVVDPVSKTVYYTEEVQQSKSTGSVKFIDAKTGSAVNLQNSEVSEVSKEEFKSAVGKK